MTRSKNSQRGSGSGSRSTSTDGAVGTRARLVGKPAPRHHHHSVDFDDDDLALARELEEEYYEERYENDDENEDLVMMPLGLANLAARVESLDIQVAALKRQASGGSDSSWSEIASEWSAVSAAESAWTVAGDDAAPVTTSPPRRQSSWGTDDAALARALQHEEWGLAKPTAAARVSKPPPRSSPPSPAVALGADALERLRDTCGLCVVCRESIALVAWEPCGHVALCEACQEQCTGNSRFQCVVCATPGAPVKLLRPSDVPLDELEDATYLPTNWSGLRLAASDGAFEESAAANSSRVHADALAGSRVLTKPSYRKAKRAVAKLSRLDEGHAHHGSAWAATHPWMAASQEAAERAEKEWADANRRRQMPRTRRVAWSGGKALRVPIDTKPDAAQIRRIRYGAAWGVDDHSVDDPPFDASRGRWTPGRWMSAPVDYATRSAARLAASAPLADLAKWPPREHRVSKADLIRWREHERSAVAEARKAAAEEGQQARAYLGKVAREAEVSARALGGDCRECGRQRACMLAVHCGHATLCRPCWEVEPAADRTCRECGASCRLALQLFKPLEFES